MKQFHCLLTLLLLCISHTATATGICWYDGSGPVKLYVPEKASMVVKVASQMFSDDMLAVTGRKSITVPEKNATIVLTQLDRASAAQRRQLSAKGIDIKKLESLTDGFSIITDNKKIYVTGTNGRGTAYGLLELSRQAGVSPWVWWGDVVPQPQNRLAIPHGYATMQGASVEYRGIFLNDEDWSLRPWSYRNYDKSDFGNIGARTYKRIFELLLRLRANAIWPGMHTGTKAFFRTEGAKAIADSCGIVIGTSHCEPLLRNNVNEWNHKERGAFNYITNKDAVQKYWIERLKEVKDSEGGNMFTIGMRGIHDGSMEGVRTMDEKHNALQQVINDQQALIGKYIGKPEQQMQVFVPYKEVLEIYERGLKVPEYATLMWCDDNYGYITRLSNADEQKRKGGGGVYYHLSYWGRPHDYLWLTTTQPGLIYNEMRQAYNHNVRKLWIVNVHDPKVAGYDLELFLDMAWN
ncbi:glycosyl hydrolase 115 family protein, partial [uncultured Muribaculum sp.]